MTSRSDLPPYIKLRNALSGNDIFLTDDEMSVVTMACHLTALHIADMPSKDQRSAAVADLPGNLADAVKAEIIQIFNTRRAAV